MLDPDSDARLLLGARGLRAFADGYVSLLLPYYLSLLGYSALHVGVLLTATLLGTGVTTLAVGALSQRFRQRSLLNACSWIMAATGVAFVLTTDFWPLLLIAAIGTINPSGGDASIFGPLEHALLTRTVRAHDRTALFARYSLISGLVGAVGAQAAAIPALCQQWLGLDALRAVQLMFLLYGVLGLGCLALYCRLSPRLEPHGDAPPATALGKSKRIVYTLAAVQGVDAFAGGFGLQSLLALWLFDRFQLSIVTTGTIFFWTGIVSAISQLIAAPLARRIGLVNTMVYTHFLASLTLMALPLATSLPVVMALLLVRSLLNRLDVPARASYIMAVVTPSERPAAASVTAVTRSLASAVAPSVAGWLFALSPFGWPFIISGILRTVYDGLLLAMFSRVRPPEEVRASGAKK